MGQQVLRVCSVTGRWRGHWRTYAILAATLTMAVVLLAAGGCSPGPTETRDDTFTVGDSPAVVVNIENGYIEVNAGVDGEVRIEATLRGSDRIDYEVSQEGDSITISAEVQSSWFVWGDIGTDIELTLPSSADLRLETSNGPVRVYGAEGSGFVRSSNGEIELRDIQGDFDVRTSNGAIEVDTMEGISFLRTSNGRLDLQDINGQIDAETSNGEIRLRGEIAAGGDVRLTTSNGDVWVDLRGTPCVALDAKTSNGEVNCDLPILATVTKEDHLVGTIGDGESQLYVRTSNGDVTVR